MKTKIKKPEGRNAIDMDYPFLGVTDSGLVVLFVGLKTGTVLVEAKGSPHVGIFRKDWVIGSFDVFEGELTLKND